MTSLHRIGDGALRLRADSWPVNFGLYFTRYTNNWLVPCGSSLPGTDS